jgi:hypothetical protein
MASDTILSDFSNLLVFAISLLRVGKNTHYGRERWQMGKYASEIKKNKIHFR